MAAAYTPEEEAALRRLFPSAPRPDVIAAIPGRAWHDIQKAAFRRGLARPRRQHNSKWEGNPIEQLHKRYPQEGAIKLAAELGFPATCVRAKAAAEGLHYKPVRRPVKKARKQTPAEEKSVREARLKKLYPNRFATTKKPKAAAKPKPIPKPVVLVPEPVKRSPLTPLLNARVEQRRLADKQREQKPKPYVTAAEIKSLAGGHPARLAWTRAAYNGPAAATEAYHQAMSQLKQVA